jgi:hypothetical protein
MKWFFLALLILAALVVLARFLWQRWRETRAQKEGVVVYATVIALEPVMVFRKPSPATKITMWLQEPGGERRVVSLSSRIPAGQKVDPGMMMPVVVDPRDGRKVYPAGEEAVKRVQLTGSREQRRQMRRQRMG